MTSNNSTESSITYSTAKKIGLTAGAAALAMTASSADADIIYNDSNPVSINLF